MKLTFNVPPGKTLDYHNSQKPVGPPSGQASNIFTKKSTDIQSK